MRIIDKQHDFYDYLQDPTDRIVFDRRGSFLLTKEIFCERVGCNMYRGDSRYSTIRKSTFIEEIQNLPILKACGIANLVDPMSIFYAIEEHFSMEKTASETTEAKGTTDEDKIAMHGFDVKKSFRKMNRM